MATNPISGLFSGIDTSEIVSKLMEVEKKPLYALQRKKTVYGKQISGYGDLLSKLSGLKESLSFFKANTGIPFSASSSNVSMLTVSASTDASSAVHDIGIKQLAMAHRVISTSGAASESTSVVTGADKHFKFKIGDSGEIHEIALTEGMTLSELKNAINNKNTDVTASIINTGTGVEPYKLVLSSNTTGASKNIIITQDDTVFNNSYTTIQGAQNAILKINGVEIQRDSNTISDAITGLTLTINKADANYGTPNASSVTVSVARDVAAIKNKINMFAAQYNAFLSKSKELSAKGSALSTDTTIDSIINQFRSITTKTYDNQMLVNLGITSDRNGFLQINDIELSKALESNPNGSLGALKGMSESLDSTLGGIINSIIPSKTNNMKDSIKRIEKAYSNIEARLTKKEESLNKKFAKLEQMISLMQSRGDYLLQQLNKMSGNDK